MLKKLDAARMTKTYSTDEIHHLFPKSNPYSSNAPQSQQSLSPRHSLLIIATKHLY